MAEKKNDMTLGWKVMKLLRALKQEIKDKGTDLIKYTSKVSYTVVVVIVVMKLLGQ